MTDLAPHLSSFLLKHLPVERHLSRHTVQSYAQCFRLLVTYVSERIGIQPSELKIEDFSATTVTDFLAFVEQDRNCCASTRNVRLATIKSFFRYLEYRVPSCLEQSLQVRAIPQKRTDKPLIDWLDQSEINAILSAPDRHTSMGLRDRAMMHLCYAAALRVSELTTLTLDSFTSPKMNVISIIGKGRRARELPLWNETHEALKLWLAVRPEADSRVVFLNARKQPLSTDGFAYILDKYVVSAAHSAPTLRYKRVTPHTLRHYLGHFFMSGSFSQDC